ncbi:MAG: hypothetical protein RML72_03135 [Bacteroidia bacterium]|nr:hypothetical protein [Bacteroidia bacterium]MDW8157856.1 hypothetical protein [Bacteroidia bacterium]
MKNCIRKFLLNLFVVFILLCCFEGISAQCPMCKMNVQAAQKRGEKVGLGLNSGILFLLSMPYLVVGAIGLVWYLQNKKKKQKEVLA